MKFSKWQGLGNDFVFVNGFAETISDPLQVAIQLCDRHFGVGADGLVLVLPSERADFKMRIINSDGSEAEMCGNASRCFTRYVVMHQLTGKRQLTIETLAGIIHTSLTDDEQVKVNLGQPRLKRGMIPVSGNPEELAVNIPMIINGKTLEATCVSTGVPHCVVFLDSLLELDLAGTGRQIETHPLFPQKTNVEFIQVVNRHELIMKVWERGAGVTLACGTGASASVVAAVLTGRADHKVKVHLDGGDLIIEWDQTSGDILMTGPAVESYTGEISIR